MTTSCAQLEVCVELHENSDESEIDSKSQPFCRDLHKMVENFCKATKGCVLEEITKATMTHISHLLTTDSLHDAFIMVSCKQEACICGYVIAKYCESNFILSHEFHRAAFRCLFEKEEIT